MAGQREHPISVAWNDDAYVRGLKRHVEQMKRTTESDVLAAAIQITNRGKSYAAVDTGFMKNSIVWEKGNDARGFFVAIYCRAHYWKHVEFGTATQSAQPFMRPAFVEGLQYLRARVGRKSR